MTELTTLKQQHRKLMSLWGSARQVTLTNHPGQTRELCLEVEREFAAEVAKVEQGIREAREGV